LRRLTRYACPVEVYVNPVELGETLANDVAYMIQAANDDDRSFVLGCPGGRSGVTTYHALGVTATKRGLDLSQLIIATMDEYVMAKGTDFVKCNIDSHYSCHRFALEQIQTVLNQGLPAPSRIPDANVWIPDPACPNDYDKRLENAGGIDLFIIASGASDGHVAFNPPETSLSSKTRVVKLAETTRRDNMVTFPEFTDISEVPSYGVTVGLGTICDLSREVVLIIHGSDKRAATRRLLGYTGFDEAWPASCVFEAGNGRILLDNAAAETLGDETA